MSRDIYFYIHIPFCYRKCPYCSFVSFEKKMGLIDDYVNALLKEINAFETNKIVKTIYLGGGTPTILKHEYIEKILNSVFKRFKTEVREITIEAVPLGFRKDYLNNLKKMGVNRISLGIQSFLDFKLKKLGRIHTSEDNFRSINAVFDAGFENVNVDMIYGIGESLNDLKSDLKYFRHYPIKHVSTYMLFVEEGTRFFELLKDGGLDVNTDDQLGDFYLFLYEALQNLGFKQYEISNFAEYGFESVHNLAYWELKEYKGFGVSASSFVNLCRFKNTNSLVEYIKDPVSSYVVEERLDGMELAKEMFIFGLRKKKGVDLNYIRLVSGINLHEEFKGRIEKYVDMGFLKFDGEFVCFSSPEAMLVSNEILKEFL